MRRHPRLDGVGRSHEVCPAAGGNKRGAAPACGAAAAKSVRTVRLIYDDPAPGRERPTRRHPRLDGVGRSHEVRSAAGGNKRGAAPACGAAAAKSVRTVGLRYDGPAPGRERPTPAGRLRGQMPTASAAIRGIPHFISPCRTMRFNGSRRAARDGFPRGSVCTRARCGWT